MNSAAERQQIRKAIALMEDISGRQKPTLRDLGKNPWIKQPIPGALDCVDEYINTTTYLTLIKQHGLLHWNGVLSCAYPRAPYILDLHYTARTRDTFTGQKYVLYSWYLDNGQKPYIQKLNDWFRKKPFPLDENP